MLIHRCNIHPSCASVVAERMSSFHFATTWIHLATIQSRNILMLHSLLPGLLALEVVEKPFGASFPALVRHKTGHSKTAVSLNDAQGMSTLHPLRTAPIDIYRIAPSISLRLFLIQ